MITIQEIKSMSHETHAVTPTPVATLTNPANPADDVGTLRDFLAYPLTGTDEIFERFHTLPGALIHGTGRERVLYLEGTRSVSSGRCLLVAHADTVWDSTCADADPGVATGMPFLEEDGVIRSADPGRGIGADDRAGLAILWLLRHSGHSLMITDLEEQGCLGSNHLRDHESGIHQRINRDHAFAIQFDRRGSRDFKCYEVGTSKFRSYLRRTTGYKEPDRKSSTDIRILCDPRQGSTKMCGVNLSVGYYDEHTADEHLVISEWLHTLNLVRSWLSAPDLPIYNRQ